MQSGITASRELHTAFESLLSDSTVFALSITITGESLTPVLPVLHFSEHATSTFADSLPQLAPYLQPKQPCYLVLRRSRSPLEQQRRQQHEPANADSNLVMVTYIPSTAPVRAKTLFASTRSTLLRELGRERFESGNGGKAGNLFVTEASEVLDPAEWVERDVGAPGPEALTREERDLREIKRAEEEEVHSGGGGGGGGTGTRARGLMGLGEEKGTESRKGLSMKVQEEAREALKGMAVGARGSQEGNLVQLSIDIATETLTLSSSSSNVPPARLSTLIPSDQPSYTFYQYPSSSAPPASTSLPIIFIYCCPGSSKIKARMLYASSRASVVQMARDSGIEVEKRIEVGAPDEMDEARLMDEIASASAGSAATGEGESEFGLGPSRPGFARPKRPGR